MKRIIQPVVKILGGIAIAGVVLAVLLPLLIQREYIGLGSLAGLWIIGGVSLLCIALLFLWPWTSRHR
ncbi:MAG TPA: hypothetical protein VH702_13690 [Vicinamibacterales bacterium]|jgi:hypothetical protein